MATDSRKQISDGLLYIASTIISSIIPFLTLPIFTRTLSVEEFGIYAMSQVYAIFAIGLGNFGISTAYERNYFEYILSDKMFSRLLFSCLFFVTINFIIISSITKIYENSISNFLIGSQEYKEIFFLAICGQFFMNINGFFFVYYKNSGIAQEYVKYNVSYNVINASLALILMIIKNLGVLSLIYAQLLSSFMVLVVLIFKFLKKYSIKLDLNIFIQTFKIAYPLTPRIFLGVISSQFDKFMIKILESVGGVGSYNVTQRIAYSTFIFMTALQNVFSPIVYREMFSKEKNAEKKIGELLTPYIYICVFVCLVCALFSHEILWIMTPNSYHIFWPIISILCLYYGFLFFGKVNGNQLIYGKKASAISILTGLGILLNVALNIPLIEKSGAIGAAWATLISGFLSGAAVFYAAQRTYKIFWEYEKIAFIYALFLISILLLIFMNNTNIQYREMALFKVFTIITYLILGIKIKILNRNNFLILKKAIIQREYNEKNN